VLPTSEISTFIMFPFSVRVSMLHFIT